MMFLRFRETDGYREARCNIKVLVMARVDVDSLPPQLPSLGQCANEQDYSILSFSVLLKYSSTESNKNIMELAWQLIDYPSHPVGLSG